MFEGEAMKKMINSCLLALLLCSISAMAHAGKTVVVPGSSAAYLFSAKSASSTTNDNSPLTLTLGASVTNITGASGDATAKINKVGKVYFVVQPITMTTPPTATQVIALKNSSNATPVSSGSNLNMAKDADVTFSMSGLAESTDYKVYFAACDNATPTPSCTAAVQSLSFKTLDATPPTTSYVNLVSTLATNASFKTKINEDGTGCYLVQNSVPTVDAIKSGNCQAMTANTEKTFTGIGGLTAGSTYKIYFLAKDSAGNWQTSYFTSATFTATDVCTTQAVDVLKDTCCYAKNSDHYSYGRAGLGYSATGSGDSLGISGTTQTYLKKTNAYGSNWWNKVTSCP